MGIPAPAIHMLVIRMPPRTPWVVPRSTGTQMRAREPPPAASSQKRRRPVKVGVASRDKVGSGDHEVRTCNWNICAT